MDRTSGPSGSIDELGGLIADIGVAMLTTQAPDGALHSRPMLALAAQPDGTLWFVMRLDSGKAAEIVGHRRVNLAYAAPDRERYVSVSGTASIVRDKGKAESLWNPTCRAWLPEGPADPNLVLLRITVEEATRWNPRSLRMEPLPVPAPGPAAAAATPGPDHEPVTLDTSGN